MLVKEINQSGGYARRFEDKFGAGILDMVVVLPDLPVLFIEAKLIKGRSFEPRERQAVEMRRINEVAGNARAVLMGVDHGRISLTTRAEKVYLTDQDVRHYSREGNPSFRDILTDFARRQKWLTTEK
jgi:hypothetical protein